MTSPDFLCIGAQRAGTTWLEKMLRQHPEVCLPKNRKEVHYFDRYYERGEEWYFSLFDHCQNKVSGEITPKYVFDDECPKRIASILPGVKLLMVLRNPIERAYSQFKFSIRENGYQGEFSDFLVDNQNAKRRGLYYQQLTRYLEYFSQDDIHVTIFEEMKDEPTKAIQEVYSFLEVDDSFEPTNLDNKANYSQIPRLHSLYVLIKKFTSKMHDMDMTKPIAIAKRMGLKRFFFSDPDQRQNFPELMDEDYQGLRKFYLKDVQKLSKLLDRDLVDIWDLDEQ